MRAKFSCIKAVAVLVIMGLLSSPASAVTLLVSGDGEITPGLPEHIRLSIQLEGEEQVQNVQFAGFSFAGLNVTPFAYISSQSYSYLNTRDVWQEWHFSAGGDYAGHINELFAAYPFDLPTNTLLSPYTSSDGALLIGEFIGSFLPGDITFAGHAIFNSGGFFPLPLFEQDLVGTLHVVPEPELLALLLCAMGALGLARRRS